MNSCEHKNLALLPEQKSRVRCKHCHLTIQADELGKSYCPECFEETGKRRYDFEEIPAEKTKVAQYRCEDCGIIIESNSR